MTGLAAGQLGVGAAAEPGEVPVERAEHAHVCANCATPLQGAYCHACGQRGHLHGRLWHMVEEFAEGIAHFDGRMWRTLPLLAFNPGKLSREWREGRRVRYVAPLHVFLFAVFLVFLVPSITGQRLITLPSDVQINAELESDLETLRQQQQANPEFQEGAQLGRRLGERIRKRLKNPEFYAYKIENTAYKLSFVLVPIGVLILAALMVFKRRFTLYDHAVVCLYGFGFLALATALGLAIPNAGNVGYFAFLYMLVMPAHAVLHLRGAYGLSWFGASVRGALLGILTLIGFVAFLLGVVALGLLG